MTIERMRKAIVPRVRSPVYAPAVPPHQRRRSRVRSRSGGAGATSVGVTSQVPQRRQNRRAESLAVPQFPQVRCRGTVLTGGRATGVNVAPGCGGVGGTGGGVAGR